MQLQEVAEIKFAFPEKSEKKLLHSPLWITAGSLLPYNVIGETKKDYGILPCDELLLNYNDIVVKRINPLFVNLISSKEQELYASTNLIIIRVKDYYEPKFIAYLLEKNIGKLYQESVGSVMPAISRKSIIEFDIGSPPPTEVQKAIGELCWLQKEKKKCMEKLCELETKLLQQRLNRIADTRGDK